MTKIEELHVGSLFYIGNKIQKITASDIQTIKQAERFGLPLDGFRPILITEETLKKYKFSKLAETTDHTLFGLGEIYISYKKSASHLICAQSRAEIGKPFTYIHQLQNICNSLFGFDLEDSSVI
ncbi:MAG: hypothetical protein UH071_04195 [Paludibacteraceae bacterium]|nr:hypothetical protein [Paludibacteraceae bacterium]